MIESKQCGCPLTYCVPFLGYQCWINYTCNLLRVLCIRFRFDRLRRHLDVFTVFRIHTEWKFMSFGMWKTVNGMGLRRQAEDIDFLFTCASLKIFHFGGDMFEVVVRSITCILWISVHENVLLIGNWNVMTREFDLFDSKGFEKQQFCIKLTALCQ